MNEAGRRGIIAAAYIVSNNVKRNLRGGYTSGEFVTGQSINAVTISDPFRLGPNWGIRVGTNLLYNLFWELGHMNIFTHRFERVEKWRPALFDSRDAAAAAYARVYIETMERGG
jgi:hypothetical protein